MKVIIINCKHEIEHQFAGSKNSNYSVVATAEICPSSFFIHPEIEGENEFGIYKVQLQHNLSSGEIQILKINFKQFEEN